MFKIVRHLKGILTSGSRNQNRCSVSLNKCVPENTFFSRCFSSQSHTVQMRGLDYETKEQDVIDFFKPLGITPKSIRLKCDGAGRVAGVSEVDFNTHAEAVVAMRKRNAFMGNRFIRLALKSELGFKESKKTEPMDTKTSSTSKE
ncbi:heterogeneous nuclear ribonucleoprotein F-like [Uloborus diversus]|uniref:heterogeneous nuclear ribonucleoprotein F-like n=1 Tax=Uloborus diversus TaxID=327109 RepID=UPI0024092DA9|nr:heterogeneous nuclear ribonucleoprotein F-like [Uloborus diversus]